MLTFSIVVAGLAFFGYTFRRNFRRSFYVLWTGDEKPDWDALYRKWYGVRWKEFAEKDNKHWWNGF